MALRVRYRRFWPGFEPESSLFTAVLRAMCGTSVEIVESPRATVDLEIVSVFKEGGTSRQLRRRIAMELGLLSLHEYVEEYGGGFNRMEMTPARKRIWYTGENKRPPHDVFDATISFDPTDRDIENLYWPYWLLRLNWGLGSREHDISPTPDELASPRAVNHLGVRRACHFSSTLETDRRRQIAAVSAVIPVDCFGSAYGRRVDDKRATSVNYQFTLTPENELRPGYVTEKLQEAWAAHTLPIWSGIHSECYRFNASAFVDISNLNFAEIRARLAGISEEEVRWRIAQPLLLEPPSLEPLIELLGRTLN